MVATAALALVGLVTAIAAEPSERRAGVRLYGLVIKAPVGLIRR